MTTTTGRLASFLKPLFAEEATELILRAGEPPLLRIGRDVKEIDPDPITRDGWRDLFAGEIPADELDGYAVDDRFRKRIEIEGLGTVEVRLFLYKKRPSATIRRTE